MIPTQEQRAQTVPKVYLRDRLYVHKSMLTPETRARFSILLRNFFPEFDEQGEPIEVRDLLVRGWRHHKGEWYSLARGNLDVVWEEFARRAEIVDQRAVVPLSFPLRWQNVLMKDGTRSPLRDTQRKFIAEILKAGFGLGKAPPRFGKTICMSAIICHVGMRALIIVHQVELAKQFVAKFRRCTNINAAEAHYRRQLVGICDAWSDFDNFDICVTTWQRFHAVIPIIDSEREDPYQEVNERLQAQQKIRYDETQRQIRRLQNRFGIVIVDEAHRAASPCFSRVVDQFNPWYRLGVTATPDRKDRRDAVIKLIAGAVVSVGVEDKVLLRVRHIYTGFAPKFQSFTAYENKIANDARRNKLILDQIEADVKLGHHVVAVCTRREHIVEMAQKMMRRGITAEGFHGKAHDRDGILARAESGHTKVVFAMRSMLLGIDIPCWSSIHVLVPSANPPNYYQEISRVRTPLPGKPYAVVRDYLDACSASNGCYKYRHMVYTDKENAPILFEDANGVLLNRVSLPLICTTASDTRQAGSKKATQDFNDAIGFGNITGPRKPNFDGSGWGGFGSLFER